jgi:hypothetical protein
MKKNEIKVSLNKKMKKKEIKVSLNKKMKKKSTTLSNTKVKQPMCKATMEQEGVVAKLH